MACLSPREPDLECELGGLSPIYVLDLEAR